MTTTLSPVFEALGFREARQQRGLVKLLQASGAFGDVKGVDGVLTDQQCDAILTHLTFNDSAQAVKLLHDITQEHLIRPHGIDQQECKDTGILEKHRAELLAALSDSGMVTDIKPTLKHYDHVLLLGAVEGEVNNRFEYLKQLWEEGVRFDKIVMLGSERPLTPDLEPSANVAGANGPITNEMQMMEARYYDPESRWPEGMEKVRIFEVNTFNKPCGKSANTKDTIESWLATEPTAGDVLAISSQPYVHYQDAAIQSVLPDTFKVETVGNAAADNVKISVALDSFARQIDVNLTKLTEKLKSESGVLKTPIIGVDPTSIKVDAATYQFRSGGDANGVTEKGRYKADKWDPLLHGDPILVHERLDGSMFVADGHHRVELAKELNAKGTGPGNIMAMVLSEKQGYTAKDAKIIAAYKNIAHGQTDVIETARVFKEAYSGAVNQDLLPSLQMDKGNLKMAFTMSKLSDKVLDQVAQEKIDPKIAEKLAETIPDDAARQEAVMKIISEKLHQNYDTPGECHATSVNINVVPMPPEPVKIPEPPKVNHPTGFVGRLAMAQAAASIDRSPG